MTEPHPPAPVTPIQADIDAAEEAWNSAVRDHGLPSWLLVSDAAQAPLIAIFARHRLAHAPPEPTGDVKQRARELLAAEYARDGSTLTDIVRSAPFERLNPPEQRALFVIEALLSSPPEPLPEHAMRLLVILGAYRDYMPTKAVEEFQELADKMRLPAAPQPADRETIARIICDAMGETWRTGEIQFGKPADELNNVWRFVADALLAAAFSLAGDGVNPCAKIFDHKWLDPVCVEDGCQSLFLAEANKLLRRLTFAARTSGGTAGPDEGLMEACDAAEKFLSRDTALAQTEAGQPSPYAEDGEYGGREVNEALDAMVEAAQPRGDALDLELLGERLFALSAEMRSAGLFDHGQNNLTRAYEAVVAEFQHLSHPQPSEADLAPLQAESDAYDASIRNKALDEAARVAETCKVRFSMTDDKHRRDIAAAIRNLKTKDAASG